MTVTEPDRPDWTKPEAYRTTPSDTYFAPPLSVDLIRVSHAYKVALDRLVKRRGGR